MIRLLAGLLLLTLAIPARAEEGTALRRFALVASSNDGGAGRSRLRFANSDGDSVARVLANLGGVRERDLVVVRDATRASLREAFTRLQREVSGEKQPGVRREIFVYYSGHSDEDGLLLGAERVSYKDLRGWIDEVGAEVRIAILDSCASGALIRLKGGVRRQPFLSDVSTQARGHAFLTASSADEAAQESDRIGAAFFTHYLISGMRGAADANRDRRVTLNEAYQFAYDETLRRTQTSKAGAQHPAYDIQLAGTGDLVMTDLHTSGARLVLGRELYGHLYVRDAAGRLLVELRKEPTYPVELGLEPGTYRVVMDSDGLISETKAELTESGRTELVAANFTAVTPMVAVRRGPGEDEPPAPPTPAETTFTQPPMGPNLPVRRDYRDVTFDLVLAPGIRLSGNSPQPVRTKFELGLIGHSDALHGVQLSAVGGIVQDEMRGLQFNSSFSLTYGPATGAQISSGVNMAMGGMRGLQLGVGNVSNRGFHGAQVAMVNFAAGTMSGAQVGMVNVVDDATHGVQVGLVNVARVPAHGGQVGLVNVQGTTPNTHGAQVGLVSVTGSQDRHGAMVSLVNVGRRLHGAQIGIVNIAGEVDGAQVGLVNFARKNSGASIGLIPIVLDGDNRLVAWYSTSSMGNVGVKLGTRHVYVLLGVGATNDNYRNGKHEFSSTFAIGGHGTLTGPLFLDVDLCGTNFYTMTKDGEEKRQLHALRVQLGYQIARHLAISAGPTLNVQIAEGQDDRIPRNVNWAMHTWTKDDYTVRMYPGFVAGLQF
jgi:hypothetical protein